MAKKTGGQRQAEQYDAEDAAQSDAKPIDPAIHAQLVAAYVKLGPPPADAANRVSWGNEFLALLAWETLVAPSFRPLSERRQMGDLIAKLGLTAVKALYEERLKKLESKVYGKSSDGNANGSTRGTGLEKYTTA